MPPKDRSYAQRQATVKLIGSLLIDKYKYPKIIYTPNDIIGDMNKQYGLQMTYMQAWRSKEYAVQVLRGNPSESYEKLLSYIYMLVLTNPMSVVSLKQPEEDLFMYAFVALYPSIKGWQYCKPVVVVDVTFLKSAYKGTLLIASTQDPAGNILPLAYAIVDSENNASWEWFFARFKDAFGEMEGMCIVLDRHEGIENAAATLYPQVPHCVYIWHLWNNVKKNYKKNHLLLKDIFFAMAKAYTVEKFDYHMAEVEKIYKRVKDYLMNVGYERWSREHSTVNRTLTMTSNIAESISAALKAAMELPVLPFLDYIRKLIGRWNVTNLKNAVESFTNLGKKYDTMLMDNLELSHQMKVTPSTSYLYSVLDKGKQRIMFLKDRTCSYRSF
ncbi:PREDICTED: protein FAR1-RELATED SEQUENCE 4-like [Nicotiana attenuata]|uniref:protein FAR1-RELATED SEQUENCE 4-like n=1 Tax=Nicotiana attenuata TaxID=49451 RepID=UPI000905A703|nr:PREDICTED: protein FAR1-RELATED SEQUENCE 4-like [Nicotiana attenuata]